MKHQFGVEESVCLHCTLTKIDILYNLCTVSGQPEHKDEADVSCAWTHHGVVLAGVLRTMFQNVAPMCDGDGQVLAEVGGPAGANQDRQLSDTAVLAYTLLWSHI